MGLPGAEKEIPSAWVQRFLVRMSLEWREENKNQPYCAALPEEDVDHSAWNFTRSFVAASEYNVRLIYGKVDVKEDLRRTKTESISPFQKRRYGQP